MRIQNKSIRLTPRFFHLLTNNCNLNDMTGTQRASKIIIIIIYKILKRAYTHSAQVIKYKFGRANYII